MSRSPRASEGPGILTAEVENLGLIAECNEYLGKFDMNLMSMQRNSEIEHGFCF